AITRLGRRAGKEPRARTRKNFIQLAGRRGFAAGLWRAEPLVARSAGFGGRAKQCCRNPKRPFDLASIRLAKDRWRACRCPREIGYHQLIHTCFEGYLSPFYGMRFYPNRQG